MKPTNGQARRFTDRDVDILKHIKTLRDQGGTVAIINEQLGELTFPEIDEPADVAPEAVPALNLGQGGAQLPAVVYLDLVRRLEAVEGLEQRLRKNHISLLTAFGVGVLVAGVFFGLLLGLVFLAGKHF